MSKQIIRSSWFSPVSMKKMEGKAPAVEVQDFVKSGFNPTAESQGVLATIKNYPLAYYDIPTANKQIFQKRLWESLNADEELQFRMKQSKSFFGEPFHQDSLEVLLPQVSHRVTDFRFADQPLLVGDVDILDTPNGNIIYSLMKSSYVGISSRGYGTLLDADDHENQIVSADDYMHVSWDFVGVPAVKEAMASLASYAKSSRLVEPIVKALLASSKLDPSLGELAKIIQSDNKKVSVTVPKAIKSGGDWTIGMSTERLRAIANDESADPKERREARNAVFHRDRKGKYGDGTSGQDRESYSDDQDRESYSDDQDRESYSDDQDRESFSSKKRVVTLSNKELIQSFFFKFATKGIPVAVESDGMWFVEFNGEGVKLGPFQSQEAAEAVINQAQANSSAVPVVSKISVEEAEDGTFLFRVGDKAYGPYASREEAQKDMEEVTQLGLFSEDQDASKGPGSGLGLGDEPKEGSVTTASKSEDTDMKIPVQSEDSSLDLDTDLPDVPQLEDTSSDISPEEEADRAEFDQMVLLEVAEALADSGDDLEASDDDLGLDEEPLPEEEPLKEAVEPKLDADGKPITAKEEIDFDSFGDDNDDPLDETGGDDEGFDDADTYFPGEDLGSVTVDSKAGTITVETTSGDGEPQTVELRLEDGFLVEAGNDVTDLDGDDESGEDNSLLPGGSLDLFAEFNGDVSAAVDHILDLPNTTGDDSTVIDLTEDEGEYDLGVPDTEKLESSKKASKADKKKADEKKAKDAKKKADAKKASKK